MNLENTVNVLRELPTLCNADLMNASAQTGHSFTAIQEELDDHRIERPFGERYVTPRQERAVAHNMMLMRINEGWRIRSNSKIRSPNDAIARAIEEMDGGAMLVREVMALADIGEQDAMARAVDLMVSLELAEMSSYNGEDMLTYKDKADGWLADYSKQGRLF